MVVYCKQIEEVGMCLANRWTIVDKELIYNSNKFIIPVPHYIACVLMSMGKHQYKYVGSFMTVAIVLSLTTQ